MIKYLKNQPPTANKVAARLVNLAIKRKTPLTPLHLQPVLYLAYISYYKQTGEVLFKNTHGTYFEFNNRGVKEISTYNDYKVFTNQLLEREMANAYASYRYDDLFNALLDKYQDKSLIDLINTVKSDITFIDLYREDQSLIYEEYHVLKYTKNK